MIFDTDIFIWIQKGNNKAAGMIDKQRKRYLSVFSYMELLQCAENKNQHKYVKDFIHEFNFKVLPLTENIGHRALIYVEEYALSSGLRAGDALIAATAIENNMPLTSSNSKHFKPIRELNLTVFRP